MSEQIRKKKEWEVIKSFQADGTNLFVEVSKLPTYNPKYTLRFGFLREDGSVTPYLPLAMTGQGKITEQGDIVAALLQLVESARGAALHDCQRWEDEKIERQQRKESRSLFTPKTKKYTGPRVNEPEQA
jgi:hypothetical protein